MAAEIKYNHFPLTLYTTHNMRIRKDLEGPTWEGCEIVYNLLRQSPLGYALCTHIDVHPTILQDFWWNAQTIYSGTKRWIRSVVMGREIILSEETLRVALHLNDDTDVTFFPKHILEQTLLEMGYNTPNMTRQICRSGLIPPWQYLLTQIGVCFSRKYRNFNELSFRVMELVHAVVQETPYNFSKYLMRDLEANMHVNQPFLMYPRFVMKVITSQLGFGGVTSDHPRIQMVRQEDIHVPSLVPLGHHTGNTTYLWVFVTCFFNNDVD